MALAAIGLGANLGDRAATIGAALRRLAALGRLVATSSLYETDPWGDPAQPPYLNAACLLETDLAPPALLREMQRVERELGRAREPDRRWGPRTIDLDLLLYDELVLSTPELTVPHPLLHARAFALVPLAEIAPNAVHPVLGTTVSALAAAAGGLGVRHLGGRPRP